MSSNPFPYVLTLVAAQGALNTALVAQMRDAVNGDAPIVLSANEAVDIPCPAMPNVETLRLALGQAAVDLNAEPVDGRRKKLLIADMDSTIITTETLDELAAFAGLKDVIAEITKRAMNGELNFKDALRERVAMLKGLSLDALDRTWDETVIMPGAYELVHTMRKHGAFTALVSGGFTYFTGRVMEKVGFHTHRSNVLEHNDDALLGTVSEPILDRDSKLAAMREFAAEQKISLADCLAVGDGANDLAMIREAGLGVAYHAKPIVAAEARTRVDHNDLRALLFFQGYRADEFAC